MTPRPQCAVCGRTYRKLSKLIAHTNKAHPDVAVPDSRRAGNVYENRRHKSI